MGTESSEVFIKKGLNFSSTIFMLGMYQIVYEAWSRGRGLRNRAHPEDIGSEVSSHRANYHSSNSLD